MVPRAKGSAKRSARLAVAVLAAALACLYSAAPAQTTSTPENAYADPAVCATCHPKQSETYRKTGMARSFYRPAAANQIEDYTRGLPYFHAPSATYYNMSVRNGRYYQTQYQLGFDGKPSGLIEKPVDYIVGSGNHTRTYLSRTGRNTLVELPLAWYAEKGGYWAMNPGYDRPDHEAFKRHIEYNCMFCHNGYPNLPDGPKTSGGESVFPATLPEGIDCQRCHGPGAAHVRSAQNRRGTIINPARLSPARKAEVCEQCHLETTSFPLPNSLLRYGRGPFSYKPGESLADFVLTFDHAPATGHDDDFEIASSAYQLAKSKCVLKTGEKLTCSNCHDPHDVQHGTVAVQRYNAVCKDCHAGSTHMTSGNCIDCHMPKRRTDDVVHVVMTDHRIQRTKPARDLLADLPERHEDGAKAYRGEVAPYPQGTPLRAGDELYVATAQVIQGSNLKAGIPRLAAALQKFQPTGPEHYAAFADARRMAGDCTNAIPTYEDALRRKAGDAQILQKMALCFASMGQNAKAEATLRQALQTAPDDPKLWTQLGLALVGQGRGNDGIAALEKATTLDPDLSEAWNDLGGVRMQAGDLARAEPALREAIRVQPNYAEAHNNLANLLSARDKFDEAKFHFEAALRYQPDYAFGRFSYGLALGKAGRLAEARTQLERSIEEDAASPDAHQTLGLVLAAQGEKTAAIAQYREAVRLRPGFARANLSLGAALAESGDTGEALPFLRMAAQSTEAPVRQEAEVLLQQDERR